MTVFFWGQIPRFTPSQTDVEIEQLRTGATKTYRLDDTAGDETLPGIEDRRAFPAGS